MHKMKHIFIDDYVFQQNLINLERTGTCLLQNFRSVFNLKKSLTAHGSMNHALLNKKYNYSGFTV